MLHEYQQQLGGWGQRHQERQGWRFFVSISIDSVFAFQDV